MYINTEFDCKKQNITSCINTLN